MSSRTNVSAIVKDVADNGAEYTIARGRQPVAVVLPVDKHRALRAALIGKK
ncbi:MULTISPECIES: type II toxin-antitoxin system Phd/YefM family antitoxin [Mycolicibacterium]|uniref:type II toxin-antitoxin system Phd/YefM family antitoxin n=1 Tax=Mycolicibacterium TaxID=1866885 RepID=UPI001CDB6CF3|nr:type II toxin-antitoxin system Phd/YefM family antitoxin [Mycolicibacterium fortuitum]UBV20344.1 hypothetical protein H8Z59_24180 [Mycolicibacterium fortuitum]